MERLIEVLRDDALLNPETAKDILLLLGPITEYAPDDEEAVDAVKGMIERLPVDELLTATLDWWFVVTTGRPSVNGGAYRLPETLGSPLVEAMKSLVEAAGETPAAQWVDAKRELTECLGHLDARMTLDFYGRSKLPKERDAWATLIAWLEPTVACLRKDRRAEAFDLEQRRFEGVLKDLGIDAGSRRWKEMEKRASQLVDFVNECARLQAVVEPWKPRAPVAEVGEVSASVRAELDPVTEILLRPVLAESVDGRAATNETASRLEEAGRATDDKGRVWLARIADSWLSRTGEEVPVLRDVLVRLRQVQEQVEALRTSGIDLTEVEVALLDDDLRLAEAELEKLDRRSRETQRVDRVERQLRRLRDVVAEAGLVEDDAWRARLDEIERHLTEGELERAESSIGSAERDLAEARRDRDLTDARMLLDEFEQLGPPESVLFDLRSQIQSYETEPDRRLASDLLPRLHEMVEGQRRRADTEARERIGEIERILTADRGEFDPTAIVDLELLLTRAQSELAGGDVLRAGSTAREVLRGIEARRVHRWDAQEGELALVDHIVSYCTGDLDFEREDVLRLHVSLKTKPFVILAGLTGSGKSSLARLYAESIGATSTNGQFRRVAVRPDWIDQSEVLGYINPISRRFEPGWLADTIRGCERNPDRLYVVLLDEMNLAPVEQYLAELLSAMEEARSGSDNVRIPLYARGGDPVNADEWSPELSFPPNLLLIGTVNVDETTRHLSDRVIDRANVLQLSLAVSSRHHTLENREVRPWLVSFADFTQICTARPADDHHEFLLDVADILKRSGIGVGIRAHVELERFVANSAGVLDPGAALDWGLVQRVIPKVRGFKAQLAEGLAELRDEFEGVGATRATSIVDAWLDPRISDDEFIDGADHLVALAQG